MSTGRQKVIRTSKLAGPVQVTVRHLDDHSNFEERRSRDGARGARLAYAGSAHLEPPHGASSQAGHRTVPRGLGSVPSGLGSVHRKLDWPGWEGHILLWLVLLNISIRRSYMLVSSFSSL